MGIFGWAAVMRVGERREGAKERAVVHSTAATAPTIAVVIVPPVNSPEI